MPRLAMLIVLVSGLGLAGCGVFDTSPPAEFASGDMQGWRYVSGKTPSRAEYAAMVAACQDGAVRSAQAGPIDSCLANLGLKRAP